MTKMFKINLFALSFISIICSTCTIEVSESEFYAVLLNGSWERSDSLIQNNNEQTLKFIDRENIEYILGENKKSLSCKYEMNYSELLLYNNSYDLIAKYNIEFVDEHKEIKITKVDSIKILDNIFTSFEGRWKRY